MKGPLPYDLKTRLSHTHVIGTTNSGKSTLLRHMIAWDLDSDASVIVIDPHSQLVPSLARLDLDRDVILIDPETMPAVNIFDVEHAADEFHKEAVLHNATTMLSYLFREQDTRLTGKQTIVFQHLCELMLVFPESRGRKGTLQDLFEFLENPAPFERDIARLPPFSRSFFPEFTAKNEEYRNTARELKYRLRGLIGRASLRRMLTTPDTTFDIGKALDNRSLVLINADEGRLGDYAAIFGKIFVALIMQAIRRRDPNAENRPVFLYVDEAHNFADEQIGKVLTDARKFGMACILAHQDMAQITAGELRAAIKGTGLKFAGRILSEDAAELAGDFRTTKDFFQLPEFHFAAYVAGKTPTAVSLKVDPDYFNRLPQRSAEDQKRFLDANRARVSFTPEKTSPVSTLPNEDVSENW